MIIILEYDESMKKELSGHVSPSGLVNILNHKTKNIQFKTSQFESEIQIKHLMFFKPYKYFVHP